MGVDDLYAATPQEPPEAGGNPDRLRSAVARSGIDGDPGEAIGVAGSEIGAEREDADREALRIEARRQRMHHRIYASELQGGDAQADSHPVRAFHR
jgi:hypothetical protein